MHEPGLERHRLQGEHFFDVLNPVVQRVLQNTEYENFKK